jgi:hypothetical protein
VALEYINEVHADLLRQLPLVTATEDLSVTSGTQEYAINEATVRIVAAEWVTSATERRSLVVTDYDYLNSEEPNWRRRSAGTPSRVYLWRSATDYVVGIDPKPNTTTSGGYPVLRLHATRVGTLTATGSLPKGIINKDVYAYGAMLRFAMDNRTYADEVPTLKALFEEAVTAERKAYSDRWPYKRRIGVTGIGMGGVS